MAENGPIKKQNHFRTFGGNILEIIENRPKIAISNPEIAPTVLKIATTDPESLLNQCKNRAILKEQLQNSKK